MKQIFKSDITGKVYDTEQECLDDEKVYREKQDRELQLKTTRKQDAEAVKQAYADYHELAKKCGDDINAAYQKYVEKRNDFIDKYGSFHMTVSDKVDPKDIETAFDELFDAAFRGVVIPWLF